MDLPKRRVRKIIEHVIDTGDDGLDAKEFSHQQRHIIEAMQSEGVDLSYDDAFTVTAHDGEVIFSYVEKEKHT